MDLYWALRGRVSGVAFETFREEQTQNQLQPHSHPRNARRRRLVTSNGGTSCDDTNEKRAVRRIVAANAPLQTLPTSLIRIDFPLVIQTLIQSQMAINSSSGVNFTAGRNNFTAGY